MLVSALREQIDQIEAALRDLDATEEPTRGRDRDPRRSRDALGSFRNRLRMLTDIAEETASQLRSAARTAQADAVDPKRRAPPREFRLPRKRYERPGLAGLQSIPRGSVRTPSRDWQSEIEVELPGIGSMILREALEPRPALEVKVLDGNRLPLVGTPVTLVRTGKGFRMLETDRAGRTLHHIPSADATLQVLGDAEVMEIALVADTETAHRP
jgi:hypothetical protein